MKILAVLFVASINAQPVNIPDLTVGADEIKTLPAQRWVFRDVTIASGGRLEVVRGSSDPLELVVQGSLKLSGTIAYETADGSERTITTNGAGGQPLSLVYQRRSMGGKGGDGGNSAKAPGGKGAAGTGTYGGGGGAGATFMNSGTGKVHTPGGDASGPEGGVTQATCRRTAGDGGRAGANDAGGTITIDVAGPLDGTGGKIIVRGGDGMPGQPGRAYSGSPTAKGCFYYPSGGGGGAPGGQGGFVVVRAQGGIVAYPTVDARGGKGGAGGQLSGSSSGGEGAAGFAGSAYWFVPQRP